MAEKEIKSTSYDIQEKWITEVAPKYFDVNNINMLRLGLFGYTNEIQSNSLEDNINMMNLISNEIYPNKAVLPNSVYAYAALGDFSDFTAKASTVSFTLALRKSDLIKYSIQKKGYKEYVISRYSTLNVDDIEFMIDYDIIIKLKVSSADSDDYVLSAQYSLNYNNPSSSIINPYIASSIMNIENEEYMFLNLTAKQLTRKEYPYRIYSNDLIENLKFTIPYEGMISYFNIFYIPPNGTERIQVTPVYVDSIKPQEDYFCFYQYSAENTLTITFSAHPDYFKPEFNSNLFIEIYTTLGSEGNFIYDGNEVDFGFYEDLSDSEMSNNSSKLLHFAYILSEAKGGSDAMNIDEIKYNSIKAFSIRKNIISDNDLDYYFKNITKNCKMMFIKKRDDMIKRIYSVYLLLRTSKNTVIPTNTLNIVLKEHEFDNYDAHQISDTYFIKPGKIFNKFVEMKRYNKSGMVIDIDNFYTVDEESTIEDIIENEDIGNYYFTCPFLLKVNTNPYFISYYLNSCDDRYGIYFEWINPDNLNEFIVNNVTINRNAILSDTYKISFQVYTSLAQENIVIIDEDDSEIFTPTNNLIGRIYFKRNNDYLGWAKCTITSFRNNYYTFECEIETNDYINNIDQLSLINSIYRPDTNLEVLREEYPIFSDDVYMEMVLFYNGYDNLNKGILTNYTPDSLNSYCVTNIFITDTPINFFKDINNIEYSTLTLGTLEEEDAYKIKAVPLIKYSYIYKESNMSEIMTLLNYFRESLQNSLSVIENNFDIDMKFYNTYGPSRMFTIGQEAKPLPSTALTVHLNIKINQILTDIIINDIQSYIIKFIEEVNTNEDSNYLYASNLIRGLENTFDYIKYIEFDHFNNEDTTMQIIENTFTGLENMTKQQIIKYVPEYLNVSLITSYDGNEELTYKPEIYITYI